MKKLLTEQLPSSGEVSHEHDFQIVKEEGSKLTLICRKGDCGATKIVEKPKIQESQGKKPLLFG